MTMLDLIEQWHRETGAHSSMTMRMRHPAYHAIVEIGWAAVPALLDALKTNPDFWFPMLRDITGENPVPPDERGFYDLMADRWLVWGEQKGIKPLAPNQPPSCVVEISRNCERLLGKQFQVSHV